MNPDSYIHNDLGNIYFDDTVCCGDKITIYEFIDEQQMTMIDFARVISADYRLDVNEVLLKYFPDIDTYKKQTYTFIRVEKCRGDRWVVLLTENGEETHMNLSETYMSFYSVNSTELADVSTDTVADTVANTVTDTVTQDSSEDDLATWELKPGMKRCDRSIPWRTDAPCGLPIKETKKACNRCASLKRTHEQSKCSFCLSRDVPPGSKLGACCAVCNEIHRGL